MTDLERITVEYEMALKAFNTSIREAYDEPSLGEFEIAHDKAFDKFRPYKLAYDRARPPKFCDIPEYGNLMSLQSFKESVEDGSLTDYDGHGNYSTATQMSDITINPSNIEDDTYFRSYSHVVWFNK